jgi:heterotetrameric sarcosine oxidase gamma subunit
VSDSPFLIIRLEGTGVVSVQAARGRAAALIENAPLNLGVALREGPHRAAGHPVDSLGIRPHRWLLVRYSDAREWASRVAQSLAGDAAVCDQSDAYVLYAASGPGVREALARFLPVDLRPHVLTPADVAVTNMGHINVVLWQRESGDSACFCLAVARSYVGSFERLIGVSH